MWILVSHGSAPVSDTGSGSARGAASSSLKLELDVQAPLLIIYTLDRAPPPGILSL